MQDHLSGGEAVPEPRYRKRKRVLVAVLVAVTVLAGVVAVEARVDRVVTPNVSTILPHGESFRLAARTAEKASARARQAPTPDDDEDLDAVALLAVSASLAVIVRMAARLPQGHPARQALAEASLPLRRALDRAPAGVG